MSAWIFSPDDKNFWEFMTPNFPKPMFLVHFHPGLVAAFMFGFYKNGTWPCEGRLNGGLGAEPPGL